MVVPEEVGELAEHHVHGKRPVLLSEVVGWIIPVCREILDEGDESVKELKRGQRRPPTKMQGKALRAADGCLELAGAGRCGPILLQRNVRRQESLEFRYAHSMKCHQARPIIRPPRRLGPRTTRKQSSNGGAWWPISRGRAETHAEKLKANGSPQASTPKATVKRKQPSLRVRDQSRISRSFIASHCLM
jgi:hypothetical protein